MNVFCYQACPHLSHSSQDAHCTYIMLIITGTVGPQRYEHLGKLGVRNCEMFVSLKFDALYCNIDDYIL